MHKFTHILPEEINAETVKILCDHILYLESFFPTEDKLQLGKIKTGFWEPKNRYCIAGDVAGVEKYENNWESMWINFPINPDGQGPRHFSLPLPMERKEIEEFSQAKSVQLTISHCFGINE